MATLQGGVGCSKFTPKKQATVTPEPTASGPVLTEAALRARVHSEVLSEMVRVVYHLSEVKNKKDYVGLVQSLNEGASIEGIYNGLVHSDLYRKTEMASRGASPGALKVFGELLAQVETEVKVPTRFTVNDARPLALPIDPGSPLINETMVFSADEDKPPNVLPPNEYSKIFVGASMFTLKRVLGDEVLRMIREKEEIPQKLHDWYGDWAGKIAGRGVDLGLAQRMSPNRDFHYRWAVTADPQIFKWEVLNRIHRVLNRAQEKG